jgi:hypothetical protein
MTMKKWAIWSTTALIAAAIVVPGAVSAADISGVNDMKPMYDYSKVEVMKKDGMDLVPLRAIAESLGYQVQWNNTDRSVTLTKGDTGMDGMTDKPMMDKPVAEKLMTDKPMTDKPMMMDKTMITVKVDSKTVSVNGMEKMLMSPVMIMNDKTYVSKELVDMYLLMSGMMK